MMVHFAPLFVNQNHLTNQNTTTITPKTIPPWKSVDFFPVPKRMTPGISIIYEPRYVVMQRLRRITGITTTTRGGLHVPWEGVSAEQDVNEFYKCLIVLSDPRMMDPQWFQWWMDCETRYLEHKLHMYDCDLVGICKANHITFDKRTKTFVVPWSVGVRSEELPTRRLPRLAAQAMWLLATTERARAHVQQCYSHVGIDGAPEMWPALGEAIAQLAAALVG